MVISRRADVIGRARDIVRVVTEHNFNVIKIALVSIQAVKALVGRFKFEC